MASQVCAGALLQCSFGVAPSALAVLPANQTMTGTPAANIMDYVPMLNILPFGMCSSPSNPVVIAATAAALGVPTPMPCIPATSAPWMPGVPTVLIGNMPALSDACTLACMWGGVIQLSFAGQATVLLP